MTQLRLMSQRSGIGWQQPLQYGVKGAVKTDHRPALPRPMIYERPPFAELGRKEASLGGTGLKASLQSINSSIAVGY